MGVIASIRRKFATFQCVDCLDEFADRIPPLYEDLPTCPSCGAPSVVDKILCYSYEMDRD